MFYEQLESLCKENGTTPTAFVRDILKLSTSKVTAWSNGSIPKIGTLKEIANYFDVTVGYLFDGKEVASQLSDAESSLIKKFKILNDIDQKRVLKQIDTFLQDYPDEEVKTEVSRKGA